MSQNPGYPQGNIYQQPVAKPSGMAVASMVLGIISLAVFCFIYISIPCAIIALVLGIIANGKFKRGEGGGGGMAKAGIICSIISMALIVLVIILWIAGISFMGHSMQQFQQQMQQQQQRIQQQQQQNGTPSPAPGSQP